MAEISKISKKDFKDSYIFNSKITEKYFDENYFIKPCDCDYEKCKGWQVLTKSTRMEY